jgi:hypothetical protein
MSDLPTTDKCVVFATPCYDHRVCYEFYKSGLETEWALNARGIARGYIGRGGDQFIAKVRNKIVSEFLTNYPMATDLFFLDDDIGWPALKVVEFLDRPEDIVAGIYPKKQEDRDFPVELEADATTGSLVERDGLVKARAVPTGFMRIKRHVLESLAERAGTFREQDANGSWGTYYEIFRCGVVNGEFNGEDYLFCQNAQALGFEIWVDPNIEFTHRGNKRWKDTLAVHLDVFRDKAILAANKLKEPA